MKKNLFCIILTCFVSVISAQTLKINEISICNISKDLDANSDYSGWIEFYNGGTTSIDLRNLYFSDSATIVKRYKLSVSRIVPPGGFGLIWINDEVRGGFVNDEVKLGSGGSLDTDNDGGFLSVADLGGKVLDKLYYGKQYTNVSYGRTVDGGSEWGYFLRSSIGKSNNGSQTGSLVVSTPIFSVSGGFYDSPQSVEIISSDQNTKVYYTLDASEPNTTKNLYNGTPIEITKTTTLRAKAYCTTMLEGTVATATYLINERKPAMPVVFLTTDPRNLYNDTIGIYCVGTNGIKFASTSLTANYNRDWTRSAHFELIDINKKLCMSQAIGVSINGNDSRKSNQKSFKISAGGKYGVKRFDYPIFKDKPNKMFKTLVLRNGGQQDIPGFIIKDAFIQRMSAILNLDYQAYEPCVVYLNGDYWGIMPFREKSNKDFVYSNYNYDKTELDFMDFSMAIEGNTLKEDSLFAFLKKNDITSESIYKIVRSKIDVDNYCRYMATEMFVVNIDWPVNNQRRFCPKGDDTKFRWLMQDLDRGFSYSPKNILKSLIESPNEKYNEKLIVRLIKNEKFREQFINTQCLVAGSVFNAVRVNNELDKFVVGLEKEHPYTAAKWDPTWVTSYPLGVSTMRQSLVLLKNKAFNELQENFKLTAPMPLQITASEPSATLCFNDLQIPLLPYDGKYFVDKPLKLKAPAFANGKKFKTWEINENNNLRYVDSLSFTLKLAADTKVKAVYLIADSVRRCGLYINEVSANNAISVDEKFKYEDWIELYNSSAQPIALNNYYITNNPLDVSSFHFTELADTIPAFGYGIVWCSNKISRGGMHANFKLDKDGGKIILAKQMDEGSISIVDSLSYTAHSDRTSFGRSPDGCDQLYVFDQPSFRNHNLNSTYDRPVYYQQNKLVSDVLSTYADDVLNAKVNIVNNELLLTNNNMGAIKVSMYNLSGILLNNISLNNSTEYQVDVSNLAQGIYLVYIKSESKGQVYKIIKR